MGERKVFGDGMVSKGVYVNQGDLLAARPEFTHASAKELERAGVRASIVARKYRNGYGAKGCRKADGRSKDAGTTTNGSATNG